MIEKSVKKYGNPVKNILYSNDNILLITDKDVKILDKDRLSPKHTIPNISKYQSVHEDKIATVGDEIRIINFKDDMLLTKFAVNDVSCIALSSVLIGIGKRDGSFSVHSIIGGKNLINLNIFDTRISKIAFYTDSILFIQSKNFIRGIDIVEKKVEFKLEDTSDITAFTVANDLCFMGNVNNELKIHNLKNNKLIHSVKLSAPIKNMKYTKGILLLQYEDSLGRFNLKTSKHLIVDNKIGMITFDLSEDEVIAIDRGYNIVKYSLSDIFSIKEKTKKIPQEILQEEPEENPIKVKFLTVDDSATMRLIIKNAIVNNLKGVEVYGAEDGIKCLEVLAENPDIDVIFMDWNMPNLNGADTVDRIRAKSIYKHIKIIMATTEGARDKVRKMLSKGVKGYLVKPFRPENIVPLAEKMIEIIKEERHVRS